MYLGECLWFWKDPVDGRDPLNVRQTELQQTIRDFQGALFLTSHLKPTLDLTTSTVPKHTSQLHFLTPGDSSGHYW